MREYLATIHEKPHAHKKRFALVTAGSFTLLIFAIWILARFGAQEPTPASANKAIAETSPLIALIKGMGAGFNAFRGTANDVKQGLEVVNYEAGFRKEDSNSLNNYGQ